MYCNENKRIQRQFASALYHARVRFQLTQQQVADDLGRSRRWYQKIEAGTSEPNLEDTLRLMVMFEIEATSLVGPVRPTVRLAQGKGR